MTDIELQQYWNTTKEDIIYGILEAVGGGMNDIEQLFLNVENDILYAVLKKLRQGGLGSGGQNFANTDLTFTGDRTHDLNNFSLWLKGQEGATNSTLTLSLFYRMLLHANSVAINADDNVEIAAPTVNIEGLFNWGLDEIGYAHNVKYALLNKINDEARKNPYFRLIQRNGSYQPTITTDLYCEFLELEQLNVTTHIKTRLNFPRASQMGANENWELINGVYNATIATEAFVLSNAKNKIVLSPGTTSIVVDAGKILKAIWFQGGSAANIGVGLSEGTNDLFDPGELTEGGDLVFEGLKPFRNGGEIFFNGVQEDTVTIIYLL